jgi:hypothetical protein
MVLYVVIAILFGAPMPAFAQRPSQRYEPAVVLKVKEHQGKIAQTDNGWSGPSYDVTIRMKGSGKQYVVLYTPPPGKSDPKYMTGLDTLVLVQEKTVTFNDVLGRSITVPILSQMPASTASPKQ